MIELGTRDADVALSEPGGDRRAAVGTWLAADARRRPDAVGARRTCGPGTPPGSHSRCRPARARCEIDERLRDRELGILDRLTSAGVAARHPEEAARRRELGKLYYRPPGGESWADVALRLRSLLHDLDAGDGPCSCHPRRRRRCCCASSPSACPSSTCSSSPPSGRSPTGRSPGSSDATATARGGRPRSTPSTISRTPASTRHQHGTEGHAHAGDARARTSSPRPRCASGRCRSPGQQAQPRTVLVLGGSPTTPGAAMLAGFAALRVGAGVLGLAVAAPVAPAVAAAVARGVSDAGAAARRRRANDALPDAVASAATRCWSAPGSTARTRARARRAPCSSTGTTPRSCSMRSRSACSATRSTAARSASGASSPRTRAEAARLLDRDADDCPTPTTRTSRGTRRARSGAVVTYSGAVADRDGRCWTVPTGHAGLGTSGSGDVLAGVVAGLLARGADAGAGGVLGDLRARRPPATGWPPGSAGWDSSPANWSTNCRSCWSRPRPEGLRAPSAGTSPT